MRVEMVKKVILSKEERGAVDILADIDCEGIKCSECPLNIPNSACIRTLCTDVLNRYGEE